MSGHIPNDEDIDKTEKLKELQKSFSQDDFLIKTFFPQQFEIFLRKISDCDELIENYEFINNFADKLELRVKDITDRNIKLMVTLKHAVPVCLKQFQTLFDMTKEDYELKIAASKEQYNDLMSKCLNLKHVQELSQKKEIIEEKQVQINIIGQKLLELDIKRKEFAENKKVEEQNFIIKMIEISKTLENSQIKQNQLMMKKRENAELKEKINRIIYQEQCEVNKIQQKQMEKERKAALCRLRSLKISPPKHSTEVFKKPIPSSNKTKVKISGYQPLLGDLRKSKNNIDIVKDKDIRKSTNIESNEAKRFKANEKESEDFNKKIIIKPNEDLKSPHSILKTETTNENIKLKEENRNQLYKSENILQNIILNEKVETVIEVVPISPENVIIESDFNASKSVSQQLIQTLSTVENQKSALLSQDKEQMVQFKIPPLMTLHQNANNKITKQPFYVIPHVDTDLSGFEQSTNQNNKPSTSNLQFPNQTLNATTRLSPQRISQQQTGNVSLESKTDLYMLPLPLLEYQPTNLPVIQDSIPDKNPKIVDQHLLKQSSDALENKNWFPTQKRIHVIENVVIKSAELAEKPPNKMETSVPSDPEPFDFTSFNFGGGGNFNLELNNDEGNNSGSIDFVSDDNSENQFIFGNGCSGKSDDNGNNFSFF